MSRSVPSHVPSAYVPKTAAIRYVSQIRTPAIRRRNFTSEKSMIWKPNSRIDPRIGAGASGTEVASAFGRLGTEVTLFEALPQILPLEDKDIARAAAREIAKQNVNIVTDANVENVDVRDDGVTPRTSSTISASPPAAAPTSRAWGSKRRG